MNKITKIEINFPVPVELSTEHQQALDAAASVICKAYEKANPTRTMWPAGIGSKIIYMPMTLEEEEARGLEFDNDVFAIDVAERANYAYLCSKCGKSQGDHKGMILNPPAGDCEFEP